MKTTLIQLLLGLTLFTSACTKVEFQQQELRLTHDVEADALDLNLSYRGLFAGNSGLDVACAWLQGMVDKQPRFIVVAWPFEFDLETIGDPWVLEHVDVERADLTVEDGPRMHLEQRLRLQSAQEGVARANAALSAEWVKHLGEADLELEVEEARTDFSWMDVRTLELILARARQGGPWISLGKDALHVHFPCSQAVFHGALMHIADPTEMEEENRVLLKQAIGLLSGLSYKDEGLEFSFSFTQGGGLRFLTPEFPPDKEDPGALAREFSGK
ncbi:MAG: hypothetical protein QF848_10080 [Planctomycetota bacterium]|nr:hypothetical protein [Planctomycetota bacterium]